MKYCDECKWHFVAKSPTVVGYSTIYCKHPDAKLGVSYVSRPKFTEANEERFYGNCGKEGKHYESLPDTSSTTATENHADKKLAVDSSTGSAEY